MLFGFGEPGGVEQIDAHEPSNFFFESFQQWVDVSVIISQFHYCDRQMSGDWGGDAKRMLN